MVTETVPEPENPPAINEKEVPEPANDNSSQPKFVAHAGWIEANYDGLMFMKKGFTVYDVEERDGKRGWFFLQPDQAYSVHTEEGIYELRTAPTSFGGQYEPGTEILADDHCAIGGFLRDATLDHLYALTGAPCTHIGGDFRDYSPVVEITQVASARSLFIGNTVHINDNSQWSLIEIDPEDWAQINPFGSKPGGFAREINPIISKDTAICGTETRRYGEGHSEVPICGFTEGQTREGNIFFTNLRSPYLVPGIPFHETETGRPLGMHIMNRPLGGTAAISFCAILDDLQEEYGELELMTRTSTMIVENLHTLTTPYGGTFGANINCQADPEAPLGVLGTEDFP